MINVSQQVLTIFSQYGFFTIILPFLLIFSLVYLITDYTQILKKDENDTIGKRLTIVFSFAFAWLSLANQQLITYLISFLPNAAFWILSILLFIMVLGLYSKSESVIPSWVKGLAFLIAVFVVIIIALNGLGLNFGSGAGANSLDILGFLINTGLIYIIIFFILIIAIVAWMTSPTTKGPGSGGTTGGTTGGSSGTGGQTS